MVLVPCVKTRVLSHFKILGSGKKRFPHIEGSPCQAAAVWDDSKTQCAIQLSLYQGYGLGKCMECYSCFSLLLLCRIALQSAVSLQATAALLPGGLPLSPQQGISGASASTLKWCVLTNHYSEKYNDTLELSQSCCPNAGVQRGREEKLQLASISPIQENDCCGVQITFCLLSSSVSAIQVSPQ